MNRKDNADSWETLRQLLVDRYDELRQRLTYRLGSADAAQETLHELYLRIDRPDGVGALKSPTSYLVTSAVNLARDRWRTEARRAKRFDVEAFYEIIDDNPGADRVTESKQTLEVLSRAIQQLTPRQRAILVAVRFDHLTQEEIAERLNISSRLVRIELQRALEHCASYLRKNS